jgi:3-oxoacyl-[acyl-carrier protein] reductase
MDLGLTGKVAVVGGGSRGSGRAIAVELAAEGVRVVVAARTEGTVKETVDLVLGRGGHAVGVACDMTTPGGAHAAAEAAREHFGPPDIAISNVYPGDAPYRMGWEDASDDKYEEGHRNLVMGVVYLAREVVGHMKEQRWGRFVNIGSAIVRDLHAPPATMVLSNVNRLAAVGLIKTMAYELGQYNITCNTIATGAISTERPVAYFRGLGTSVEAVERQMAEAEYPNGVPRLGRPEEMAALAAFLCSDRASFVSGETIGVTGGKTGSPGL